MKTARFVLALLLVLVALVAAMGPAPARAAGDAADRIQKRYESIKSFTTEFDQTQTRAAIGVATDFSGRIWYQRPGLVRWETLQPEEAQETIVIGKESVWDYVAELNTASKMRSEDLMRSKTLLRFISGEANLRQDFKVEDAWDGDENIKEHWKGSGLLIYRLVPHEPEAGLMIAYIGVRPDDFLMQNIMVVDYQGNANELRMKNIQLDADMPKGTFDYAPAAGVTVQDLTQPQAGQPAQ
ncbi:MAG: outer membrane lipoprotein carrier protein LolA [Desulfovibrionaceae bacterium]